MQIAKASKKAIIWFFVVLEAKIPIALKPAVKKIDGVGAVTAEKTENTGLEHNEKTTGVLVQVKDNMEIRPQIAEAMGKAGFELYELSLRRNSLEDIFHTLTEDSPAENALTEKK